ncbi:MAG TPA: hypothetical protein VM260_01675 [Pirellula sp.]|nr:hypothetical protein [Pirellula sp.]
MLSEPPIRWIVWGIVVFVALRSLISLAIKLRDRLQSLLVEHVKKQQMESQKRQRIKELREKIRSKKANAELDNSKEKRAA